MGSACAATRWSGIRSSLRGRRPFRPTSCAPRCTGTSAPWPGDTAGKVAAWDVVNEALADGPSGAAAQRLAVHRARPDASSTRRFGRAQADPDAQLFYNDYEIEGEGARSPRRRSPFASGWWTPACPSRASACRCTSTPATGRPPTASGATWSATRASACGSRSPRWTSRSARSPAASIRSCSGSARSPTTSSRPASRSTMRGDHLLGPHRPRFVARGSALGRAARARAPPRAALRRQLPAEADRARRDRRVRWPLRRESTSRDRYRGWREPRELRTDLGAHSGNCGTPSAIRSHAAFSETQKWARGSLANGVSRLPSRMRRTSALAVR